MTSDLYRMHALDLRNLVRELQEEVRLASLTRAASSHSLNKILEELRRAEECADRLRTQRDRAVDQYKDTHKDLLIVESQVTAFGLRVEEGEAKYRLLSKQWSFLLSHKNYAERQVGKLQADVKQLKSEAVSNQAHISSHMGRDEGGSQCVQQLRTQVEALKEENARLDHASVRYFMDQQTTKVNEAMAETARALSGLSTADGKVAKLARDLAACREQDHVLRAELRHIREEWNKLGEEWNKLLEQKQALEKDNDKLRRQWHISEECLDSSLTREKGRDERLSELQAERNQLNRDLAKANAILSVQEAKDRAEKTRLENMRASRDIWHRKGLELKAEIQCLIEERDKAEAKYDGLVHAVDCESDYDSLAGELHRIRAELADSKRPVSTFLREREALKYERDNLLAKKHKLGQQLQQADRQDDRRCTRIAYLQEAGEQLAADLATAQAQVRVLKHRIGRLTTGETIASLGIGDLAHKEQIVALEVEHNRIELVCIGLQRDVDSAKIILGQRYSRIVSLREKLRQMRVARDDADSNAAELRRGKQGWVDRILSLTEEIVVAEQQLKTVTEAYHALHLESGATTKHPPLRPTDPTLFFPGWTCVRCGKDFASKREAHDMDKHEPDCNWVELSEVRAITQQCVAEAADEENQG